MSAEHPAAFLLEQFMRGELADAPRRRVVRHLLAGCEPCREITRQLWALGCEKVAPQPRTARAKRRSAPAAAEPAAPSVSRSSEIALSQERHELLRAGLGSEAARISFELALRLRQEDRAEELAALAADLAPILRTGDVSRSVAAALLVFRRLAETRSASEEFLREAVRLASGRGREEAAGEPAAG